MILQDLLNCKETQVLRILQEAGYESYFVGGCVRDAIMGRECNDIDITTSARPQETEEVFKDFRLVETGLEHGTVVVIHQGAPVEITTFRSEGEYTDKRHPDCVYFVRNVEEDLARRDFTMNALALNQNGSMVDPFGGMEDIKQGIIRAVGNPGERFQEDALRIMRAIRFSSQLGFQIEEETEHAMLEWCHLLKGISRERVYAEFQKLILGPHAGAVIEKYVQVLGQVIPHLEVMDGFQQHNPHHKYDVLRHCIKCMENMRVTEQNQIYMKMAGLFHDIGKPDTFAFDDQGIGHCYGHPAVSAAHVEEILRGLKADSFTIERVTLLTKYHDLVFKKDSKLLKRWLRRFGPEVIFELLEIKRADNLAVGCDVGFLVEMFDEIHQMLEDILAEEECFQIRDLKVDGHDIMEHCQVTGRPVGQILDKLLDLVIDDALPNEKAPLLGEAMLMKNKIIME